MEEINLINSLENNKNLSIVILLSNNIFNYTNIMSENKSSFFFLALTIPEGRYNETYLNNLTDLSDLVFSSINASATFYKFQNRHTH
jgi:hypothetical protein